MALSIVNSSSSAATGTNLVITAPASIVAGNLLFSAIDSGDLTAANIGASQSDIVCRVVAVATNNGSATVTIPASVQVGDLMVAVACSASSLPNNNPGTWTQRATDSTSDFFISIWTKIADSGDTGGSATINFGGSSWSHTGFSAWYSFSGGSIAYDTSAITASSSSGTSMVAPSVTTANNYGIVIAGGSQSQNNGVAITIPTGGVQLWGTGGDYFVNNFDTSAIYFLQATAGASATKTFTSNASHPTKAYQIALKSSTPGQGEGWINILNQDGTASSDSMATFYKVATGSEPASYRFYTPQHNHVGGIIQIIGQAASPIDASGGGTVGVGTTATATSITTVTDSALLLGCFGADNGVNVITKPSNMTEQFQQGGNHRISVAYRTVSPAGATGSEAATLGSSDGWTALLVAITPGAPPLGSSGGALGAFVLPQPNPYQLLALLAKFAMGAGGYDQAVGNLRETQTTADVIVQGPSNLRETQISAEVAVQDSAIFRLTQDTIDATIRITEHYRLTQATMDVLIREGPLPPPPPPPPNPTTNAGPPHPSSAIIYALDRQVFEPLQQFTNTVRAATIEASQTGVTWAQLVNPWSTYTAQWDSFASQDQVGVFIGLDDGVETTWADLPLPWSSYPQSWNSFPAGGNVDLFSDNSTTDAGMAIPFNMVPALDYESSRQDILLDSWDFILKIASFFELLTVEFDALKQPLSVGVPITATPISLNDKSTFSVSKAYPGAGQSKYSRYIRVTMSGQSFTRAFAFAGATIFVQIQERPSK